MNLPTRRWGTTILAGLLAAGAIGAAHATTTTFSGQDDGALTTGPFPNSNTAQASFLAAASVFGPTHTITYESLATGYYSPIAAAPGVSITLTGTNFGPGFSGISNTTLSNLYGFNTTSAGSQWLGFAMGSATFTFATPTHSFGTFLTGLQTVFSGTNALQVTFSDGTSQLFTPAINVDGGAAYFGFTDTSPFSSLTLTNLSSDAWGIDDTTFNGRSTSVPEPGSLGLLSIGALLIGAFVALRRRLA
ncbi:PEP-CTERM domain protein [Rhodanobacter thiooxydans]|uniref:PEP-CTERM domain protein n=1 Tax=Rhodanobacter thiooxydans TaxID=416169 RepID=A0A154QJ48_9GAMM|nr:PEP-CTERM sorting domain-containing protein [Rhodanobacter thiooxydans]EIM02206.1 hypothetical protein UUA_02911 [Rhodanobacter thiooxydans LCS2]KZC23746.1 PEP-CTERM domain protein [Rhodanobacter thiooxydans]MCW0200518.1 PEP-CTERM sorting domain-containing protein [Rhodanobacter thiooxydans]